jgi:hypothetical protein
MMRSSASVKVGDCFGGTDSLPLFIRRPRLTKVTNYLVAGKAWFGCNHTESVQVYENREQSTSFGIFITMPRISFGDKVRIRSTAATEALNLAGKTGIVHGRSTVSVTGVDVIGTAIDDGAIAVDIEGQSTPLWFSEDVVEFIDHSLGMIATFGGHTFIRDEDGEWHGPKPC